MTEASREAASPFHRGEREVQARLGVRDTVENLGRRMIVEWLPEQHRAFYSQLPFLLLGTVDGAGRPWASILTGRPGFLASPDPRRLEVAARPLDSDPANETLTTGADVGILGIELETRRRNRIAGRVARAGPDGFAIDIVQAFGNCPQYIQTRKVAHRPEGEGEGEADRPAVHRAREFDESTRALIAAADTLFIATAHIGTPDEPAHGVDVSHRGGRPGFVRVEDARTFVFPDFAGNNHFNTIGNLHLYPKAGFLFVDFASGDLVQATGEVEIVWDGDEVRAFAGATRLLRFRAHEVIRHEAALPLRFAFDAYSPSLDLTGDWARADETLAAERERDRWLGYEVFEVRPESEEITSFRLRRADGKAPAPVAPGQFLPIRVAIPDEAAPVVRTYTVSDAADGVGYRLSIKREGAGGLVSNFLHDNAQAGFRLEAMAPRGKFVLDPAEVRPVVLLSGGVGITPMIAMVNAILAHGARTRHFRRTWFIHGARNRRAHAFGAHIRALAARHEWLNAHIRYGAPGPDDRAGIDHDGAGRIDGALLRALLPLDDYDFYLCGPPPFMRAVFDALLGLGVAEARIHYESFGPATVLGTGGVGRAVASTTEGPVAVRFARSEVEAAWTPAAGSLLELAEASGLAPPFACRSGVCGTCATGLVAGRVETIETPSAALGAGEVLLCCTVPGAPGEGEDGGIVLDL